MTIQIKNIESSDHRQNQLNLFVRVAHSYPKPSTRSGGVSFPTVPSRKPFVLATTIGALGATPVIVDANNLKSLQNIRIVLPATVHAESTAAKYERLRNEIVASGIPLLNDEELRKEIAERKGRSEPAL